MLTQSVSVRPLSRLSTSYVLGRIGWTLLLATPWVWWQSTTDVPGYIKYGAPDGQVWYVFSKLLGLYAAVFLWLQALCGLLKPTPYRFLLPNWARSRHALLGGLTVLVLAAHIGSFITAVSLRKDRVEWTLLLPDFRDFYHTSITVGLAAFFLMLIAVMAAKLRRRLPEVWRWVHRLMLVVIALGLLHGFLIGTETRDGFYAVFYGGLAVTYLLALVLRWHLVKTGKEGIV